jgi:hypothetical protein
MKDNTAAVLSYIFATIKNIVCLVAFAWVAIYFNKWWIMLFSGLFLSSFTFKMEGEGKENGSSDS